MFFLIITFLILTNFTMFTSTKIPVSQTIRELCQNYLTTNALGKRGIEDGSAEQQLTGLIGQVVVYHYLKDALPDLIPPEGGFDGGIDVVHNSHKIDVKTMGRNSYVKGDYVNNFYDKGHLAPAGSFNCNEKMLIETFSYLNCALQRQELNRGVWKYLENHERVLAQRYKVNVIVKCVFSKNSIRLKTGATIPDAFYKEIYYDNKVEIYYFPNEVPKYRKYINYKIENPLK